MKKIVKGTKNRLLDYLQNKFIPMPGTNNEWYDKFKEQLDAMQDEEFFDKILLFQQRCCYSEDNPVLLPLFDGYRYDHFDSMGGCKRIYVWSVQINPNYPVHSPLNDLKCQQQSV